jgi:hypothetical protein
MQKAAWKTDIPAKIADNNRHMKWKQGAFVHPVCMITVDTNRDGR